MARLICRSTFTDAIEAGIQAAALSESGRGFTAEDLAALRAVAALAQRSIYGCHEADLCGCPLTQAGLWTDEDMARIGHRPFDAFYGAYDRYLMEHKANLDAWAPFEIAAC